MHKIISTLNPIFVTASEARQSMDCHVTSFLAMTMLFGLPLLPAVSLRTRNCISYFFPTLEHVS